MPNFVYNCSTLSPPLLCYALDSRAGKFHPVDSGKFANYFLCLISLLCEICFLAQKLRNLCINANKRCSKNVNKRIFDKAQSHIKFLRVPFLGVPRSSLEFLKIPQSSSEFPRPWRSLEFLAFHKNI